MRDDRQNPTFSSLVHQVCGAPDLLAGLTLVTLGLATFDPRLWFVHAVWVFGLLPLVWSRFRLRLLQAGVGYRPLPPARLCPPILAGVAAGLVLSAILVARFRGPIPGLMHDAPAVAAAFVGLLALTGVLVAASLRWLRWHGYALVLLLGCASLFLGVPPAWPFLATGLLMAGSGLAALLRFLRRHPQILR